MALFAFCLAISARSQTDVDWSVYGEKNSRPRGGPAEIEQGGSLHFQIASNVYLMGSDVPNPYTKALAPVEWSIQPSATGVSVGADGTVFVSVNSPTGGYKITARAGDQSRSLDFLVYDPKAAPLTGTWGERAEISCGGAETDPTTPIRELIFRASGRFSATWIPFETRKDYWGSYTYDVKTEKLAFRLENGNYRPTDISPDGNARIDSHGRLIIRGIWLGSSRNERRMPNSFCGYVFAR